MTPIQNLKLSLLQIIIVLRVHEREQLSLFCTFQKKLRVQDLQVHRDSFTRMELKLSKIIGVVSVIVIPIPMIYYFLLRYMIDISDDYLAAGL